MKSGRGSSPIGFFEELYAIVVGLGLALAVEQVIDLGRPGLPVVSEHLPLFLAYLNIAFALAHASVRYLQLTYAHNALGPLTRARVIADLVLGVGHFLWLMALSFLITRPSVFAYVVIVLLIGRPLRDGLLMFLKQPRLEFDRKVVAVHLVTVAGVLAALGAAELGSAGSEIWVLRFGLMVDSLFFGLAMYLFAFPYFFPTVGSED